MRPVCVPCHREMKVESNGVYVLELAEAARGVYRIWFADTHSCQGCGTEIVTSFSKAPYGEHWQSDFKEKMDVVHRALKEKLKRVVVSHEIVNGKNLTERFWPDPRLSEAVVGDGD